MGEADEPPLRDRIRSLVRNTTAPKRAQVDNTPNFELNHQSSSDAASNEPSKPTGPIHLDGSPRGPYSAHARQKSSSNTLSPSGPPPFDAQDPGPATATVTPTATPRWSVRIKAGSKRFLNHTKEALLHSWINLLLIFVPVGIAVSWAPIDDKVRPTIVFAMNAVAIIPLAGLLAHATESVASRMGDTWASLLNVSFGNAVELIIFIIALVKNEIRIVQASILGSILANLLLILGMSFLLGGLRFREQVYNNNVTQMSACLLSLSVTSLLLPTAFHASFADNAEADARTTKISRGTSIVLLLVYGLYLLFQLKSHPYMYESTPQKVIDEESHPGVLADIMDSSSSSSDSDATVTTASGSSSDSHNTTKKRIKRAFKPRRRRVSSTSTNTGPSAPSSPSNEKRSARGGVRTPQKDGYFDMTSEQREAAHGTAVMSGDEADTDGEPERRQVGPQVRDFETEKHGNSLKTSPDSVQKKSRKKAKKKRKNKHRAELNATRLVDIETKDGPKKSEKAVDPPYDGTRPPVPNRQSVAFAENESSNTASVPPRRHFTRQISRPTFKAPPFFSNTVFTTPQPPPTGNNPQPVGLYIARPGIRRTSSLPDRLNKQQSGASARNGRSATPAAATSAESDPNETLNNTDAAHDQVDRHDQPQMSRTAAVVLLLCTTALVAFCAELLVDAIPAMISDTPVSQAFIGLIILPIVGNAAEHVTAVTVATKNKMDLAIGVSVGSSIQIALFITPVIVLLGWILGKDMSLYFNLFETVSLFVTAFVVNFLVLDGRSNYLEGSLLIAAYVIIAVAAYFYPNSGAQSQLGGNNV